MSLKEKLDAFRAQVESGRRIPIAVVEKLHKSTEELVASGQAERAKKAGDRAPTFELRDIEARGGQLVAISMQTAPNSRRSIEQNKLGFPILIDLHGITANAYGLRFALPDYLIDIYKNVFKNDLAVINDDPSWTLPMPARYVIGQNSMIAYAEVNPDYTRRPEPVELLPVLDRLGALVA
jgi:peroxiredoxin